jgi:hypothetical protein
MNKYDPEAQRKVHEALSKFNQGKLMSGNGKKVTSREQAIAIGLSEARDEGAKVPENE